MISLRSVRHFPTNTVRSVLPALCLCCCLTTGAFGQLEGRIADKPLGSGYLRGINQKTSLEYTQKLAERLEIGSEFVKMIANEDRMGKIDPDVEVPIYGAAYYMVQGLIPSWEAMYFQQVADAADGKRVIEARGSMFGPKAVVSDLGEDCFELVNRNSWNSPVPKGKTAEEHAKGINARQTFGRRGYSMSAKVVEKDGKEQVEQTWEMKEYYRIQENLLFSANFEELWTADLPSADSVLSTIRSTDDAGIELFFDRIPQGLKQLGWGMIMGGAGAEMQQRDGEELTVANLRKNSMQFGLDLLKAVLFDVDEANGWLRFATEEEQSIRGELNFDTRSNSSFAERLGEWSSGNSRFGAILRDDAPGTLHLCIKLFEESDPTLAALGQWLTQEISTQTSGDPKAVNAIAEVSRTLNEIGQHQTLEVMLKAGWSEETDGVIYGGIQVDNNPNLLKSLYTLAYAVETPPDGLLEMIEKEGVPLIQIVPLESEMASLQLMTSLNVSHVFIAHRNASLWFAAGNENAWKKLLSASEQCANSAVAGRAPLFTARGAFDEWMQLPEDDPVGVGNLIRWLDANVSAFPPSPVGMSWNGGKPTPILDRVFELGGEQNAGLTVIADKAGLRAKLNIGEAIGNYYVARMVDMQDRMFSRNRKQQEAAAKKARESQKKKVKAAEPAPFD